MTITWHFHVWKFFCCVFGGCFSSAHRNTSKCRFQSEKRSKCTSTSQKESDELCSSVLVNYWLDLRSSQNRTYHTNGMANWDSTPLPRARTSSSTQWYLDFSEHPLHRHSIRHLQVCLRSKRTSGDWIKQSTKEDTYHHNWVLYRGSTTMTLTLEILLIIDFGGGLVFIPGTVEVRPPTKPHGFVFYFLWGTSRFYISSFALLPLHF